MKAALLESLHAPLAIRDIGFAGVGFGQVRVRMLAAGICGAQLQEIRGEKGGPLPHTMGHEGCGIVEETGPGVTHVHLGDKVVLHWRKGAGIESEPPEFLLDKDGPLYTTGRCTTWAEQVVVSENRCTAVPPDTPTDLCVLLGCGLSTALGTIENEAGLRFGQSVLVVGVGGLGANLIRAARFAHAHPVVACDCAAGKSDLARLLGADAFADNVQRIAGTFDCVIDTTGDAETMGHAFARIGPSGRGIMVGQPKPGRAVELHAARHFFDGEGKTLLATQGGGHNPARDIPRYVRLWQSGALKLHGIITHRVPLARINDALELVKNGEAGRIIVDIAKEQ